MSGKVKSKATNEQIEALINKYSNKENVLELFYNGPVNTCIRLETALKCGVSINSLAYGYYSPINLPEYKDGCLPAHNLAAYNNHMKIVKIILVNFVSNNPQYFRKVSVTKYAVSDEFVLDILLHHQQKGFDALDLSSIFPYITNQDIFTKIVELFYLPCRNDETLETLKRKYLNKRKPYKFRKRIHVFGTSSIGQIGNN
jgi:hypothetical protein